MIKATFVVFLSLAILLVTQTSLADCAETLSACDKALNLSQQVINDQKIQIQNYSEQSALQQQINQDQEKELNEWYRKPTVVIPATVAVVLTILLISGHTK